VLDMLIKTGDRQKHSALESPNKILNRTLIEPLRGMRLKLQASCLQNHAKKYCTENVSTTL